MRSSFAVSVLLCVVSGCSAVPQRSTRSAAAEPKGQTTVAPPSARTTLSESEISRTKATELPALYADLFEVGRRFTYAANTESSYYDPEDERAEKNGEVVSRSTATITCVVTEVRSTSDVRFASLDCSSEGNESFPGLGDVTPAGIYAATKDGLHRLPLDVAPVITPSTLIVPREPKPERRVEKTPDGESSTEVAQYSDGTVCFGREDTIGDASYLSLCLSAGKGIVSVVGGSDGGSTHSSSFNLTTNS